MRLLEEPQAQVPMLEKKRPLTPLSWDALVKLADFSFRFPTGIINKTKI
jgi:hypothetical protein